jgi:hypothetical protein
MTRKSITTSHRVIACDVCGRTLLRGENADVFLHGGSRKMVCELCTARAMHEGWIREGLDDVHRTNQRERGGGARSLLGRLRARREVPAMDDRDEVAADGDWGAAPHDPAAYEAASAPPPPSAVAPPEPVHAEPAYEPPQEPRSVRGVPSNADLKVARALDVFNSGEAPRRIAGIARSLGVPIVTARPSATEGSVVTIVVAWELSWYRYEIDLADEAAGPRVVDQGTELSELETVDQTPNAAADDQGLLHPAATLT